MIPKDIMEKHHVRAGFLIKGPKDSDEMEKVQNAVHDVASQAFAHYDKAKDIIKNEVSVVDAVSIQSLFPAVTAGLYLDELKNANFNPFDPTMLGRLKHPTFFMHQINLIRMKFTRKLK